LFLKKAFKRKSKSEGGRKGERSTLSYGAEEIERRVFGFEFGHCRSLKLRAHEASLNGFPLMVGVAYR
jgi:hypothetical protein